MYIYDSYDFLVYYIKYLCSYKEDVIQILAYTGRKQYVPSCDLFC